MATPDSELEYLSPDFDPASITVPRLRSILVAHSVSYPSSAKKPELIALFNEHVVPQARKVLNARSKTKRSEHGIVDMSSRESSVASGDTESDATSVAPPETVRRSTRRTTRSQSVAEDPDATPRASARVGRTPAKRTSSKHARASEPEVDEPPPRKSRQSISATPSVASSIRPSATPSIKQEPLDEESPFTQDNPFQSGSSPMVEPHTVERERRRRTLGLAESKDKRKSVSTRRRAEYISADQEQQQQQGMVVPSSKTFEAPVTRRRSKKDPTPEPEPEYEPEPEFELEQEDGVDIGEEFTPEEQLELVRERARSGQVDILPPRKKTKTKESSSAFKTAPWAILVALLGGYATWWRQEKLQVGYCGVGRPSIVEVHGLEIPEFAQQFVPQCEPCPQHAYCYPELKTVCEDDFILRPHPLSLGGITPLAPTCEPDGEKARKVKAVADRAVEELRERNAKYECGDLVDEETGRHLTTADINEQDLKEEMSTKRRRGMSQSEFDDLWVHAIGEITGRDEITSGVDGRTGNHTLASNSLARISFACAARRSVRLALARHLWKLVVLLAMFGTFLYGKHSITSSRAMEDRAKQLASYALDRLAHQAALHAFDSRAYPEPYISMGQLRDDILRSDFSAKRRQRLWERVQKKVEGNSNIRPSVRENRSGDVSRVWEWIGAIAAIEDSSAFKRSGSGERSRLSMGSPPTVKEEMKEMVHWDEGRPVY
ncbi:uncharacterized protein K452DRAFT_225993 [Aplosporella prunicola CBS 121167]|uniref:LEM-like domain-containing protein n=1 Tax=Aplosporella prunicola CBS 121167 TaxID=1176127 RepID=A0A6A6BHR2_9PEZI|nr:uncharacterized protein K452DRAFT_225993 [Aplosporella prunicola CBS 121167]KAF2142983.1 hypothetical protein K452DRAFT_225993 [Aplosporella prunicola CBS 121167]